MTSMDLVSYPVILSEVLKHVEKSDIRSLRVANQVLCNAVDQILWRELCIKMYRYPLILNSTFRHILSSSRQLDSLYVCLKRNVCKLKKVRIETSCLRYDSDKVAELFRILIKADNVEELILQISYWKLELREEIERIAAPLLPKVPLTIEITEPIVEPGDVVRTIAAVRPCPDDLLAIKIPHPIEIDHLAPQLFTNYGAVISRLECRVNTANRCHVQRLAHLLKSCTSLRTFRLRVFFDWKIKSVLRITLPMIPEIDHELKLLSTKTAPVIKAPESVENFTLSCADKSPTVVISSSEVVYAALGEQALLKICLPDIKCLTIETWGRYRHG